MAHYGVGEGPSDVNEMKPGDTWTRLDGQVITIPERKKAFDKAVKPQVSGNNNDSTLMRRIAERQARCGFDLAS